MFDYSPTELELMFWRALALIAAACLFTPIFRKLGLGPILGYLAGGIAVNLAFGGKFSEHPEELLHFSEFGVVLFLFVIGLELKPQSLWRMRSDIFGLGLLQLLVCGLVLGLGALVFELSWSAALIVGLGLALSSTAIVMKQLDERRERNSRHGRKAFSILLLQDLAVVPLLLLTTLLAPTGGGLTLQESVKEVSVGVGAIIALILTGHFLLPRLFHLLSAVRTPEIMTASALGVVIGAALLMDMAGMSYAMGAFLAGVLLADSSYRHEIEANIEPFRGLFLGLFFMAVGVTLDLNVIQQNALVILLVAPLTMVIKGLAIYTVTRVLGNDRDTSVRVALALAQLGEFGFVLFAAAAGAGVLSDDLAPVLIAIVSVSMALSPFLEKLLPILLRGEQRPPPVEDYSDAEGNVLIIGFGRFGQVLSQPLFADGLSITILDNDPVRIEDARRFGFRVHYGDGTRRDILRAAGIESMTSVIVCTQQPDITNRIVEQVMQENQSARIYARSFDRIHSIQLRRMDTTYSVRETFESALALGRQVLLGLGSDDIHVEQIIKDVRKRDLDRLKQQAEEGIMAGLDKLHSHQQPVRPEPLDLDG